MADTLMTAEGSVFAVLAEHMTTKNVQVGNAFVDFSQQCVGDSEHFLTLLRGKEKNFFMPCMAIDQKLLQSRWNVQWAEWRAIGKSYPTQLKTQKSAEEATAAVLCDAHGIIFIDYRAFGWRHCKARKNPMNLLSEVLGDDCFVVLL